MDILSTRLQNQHLIGKKFTTTEEVVKHLGAVQSQDYPAAKWGVAQRLKSPVDEEIEKAFNDGVIVRTHILRPTWHFVHNEDIKWMLSISAPRVHKITSYYYKMLELDTQVFRKSINTFIKTLQHKNFLTRDELKEKLKEVGITGNGMRIAHILFYAELEEVIISGPRKGKQFTYALMDERAPHAKILANDEALAELVKRYFVSRGPAQIQDFVWWSGLTTVDTKKGLEINKNTLMHETVSGKTYYFSQNNSLKSILLVAHLLPNYDEYTIAYKDRSDFYNPANASGMDLRNNIAFNHSILINGFIVGGWRRTLKKSEVIMEIKYFRILSNEEKLAVGKAVDDYGKFLSLKPVIHYLQ